MRVRLATLAVLLCFGGFAAAQKLALPETPAGQRFGKLLRAFNSGDEENLRSFIAANYTPAALADRDADSRAQTYLQLYRQTRGFYLQAVSESQPAQISAIVQARLTENWWTVTLLTDPASRDRVRGVTFRATPRPAEFTPHVKLSAAEIAAGLGKFVDKLAAERQFSGVVLLSAPGGIALVQKTAGSTHDGEPVKLSTTFGLASISKLLTAVAVAQLVASHDLSFDDRLSKFFPDYPKPAADQITVRHLLMHTSGLPAYMDARYFERPRNLQEHVEIFSRVPLSFPPGARFQYSNAGYMLLRGVVVAASGGQPYGKYLEEHIFAPAGMKPENDSRMTASDLLCFAAALRSGKLLSPEMLKTVTTGRVETGEPGVRYGFGFEERTINGERLVGHGGGAAHVSAQFDIYDNGYTVVVMSDDPNAPTGQIAMHAADLITQK